MSLVFEDIQLLEPTILFGAPRFFKQIYDEIEFERQKLIASGKTQDQSTTATFETYKNFLGKRLHTLVSGGAPMSPIVQTTLEKCFHCTIIVAYGTTESGNIALGTEKLSSVKWKLIDLPDLGYLSSDKPYPRGELAVQTTNMFTGYYKDKTNTNDAFDQGYFRTGDIVQVCENENIVVIARRKETFKLSNGEFVQPQRLEEIFSR